MPADAQDYSKLAERHGHARRRAGAPRYLAGARRARPRANVQLPATAVKKKIRLDLLPRYQVREKAATCLRVWLTDISHYLVKVKFIDLLFLQLVEKVFILISKQPYLIN